jgi:geranylgeranyl diphosphate synthase type I
LEISALLSEMRAAIEADLKAALQPLQQGSASPIGEMVAYHLGWNQSGAEGKRVRPLLTLLCCGAVNEKWQSALPAASAIEWIHNFSLIHDDIQDQSKTRRGRETLWALQGIAQAINTGDAVFALARLTTQRLMDLGIGPEVILRTQALLDQACLELTVGQHLDIAFEDRPSVQVNEYIEMIGGKTGALLYAACASGALIAGADVDKFNHFGEFGRNVGLAFQMYDDLLGIWGDAASTGKPTGDDLRSRKKTLPILYGIQNAKAVQDLWEGPLSNDDQIRDMILALEKAGAKAHVVNQAEEYTERALSALQQARPLQPYGEELGKFARQLLQREH